MGKQRILFISYAHEDQAWLECILDEFRKQADPDLVETIWTDKRVQAGEDWKREIAKALARARVGCLIVSNSFHDSDFIRNLELPELLSLYDQGRIYLTWVRVDNADYRMATYGKVQSLIPPHPPLDQLPADERQKRLGEAVTGLIGMLQGRRAQHEAEGGLRHLWRAALGTAGLALCTLIMFLSTIIAEWRPERTEVLQLLHQSSWIGYEPARFNPAVLDSTTEPEIIRELATLREVGFTGIVTYGSRPDLACIPRLAHEHGFKVIMGVWNPLDDNELRVAYDNRQYVDAYCVGHNCLSDDTGLTLCSERQLQRALRWLRERTRKPVATTQLAKQYTPEASRLNTMGDFLCPDVHHAYSLHDLDGDIRTTVGELKRIAAIAERFDQPVMVKSLTYPVRNTLQEEPDYHRQADYFEGVVNAIRDPLSGTRIPVALVAHGAFDSPWKQGGSFLPWDPYTGLFHADGKPRAVVGRWMRLRRVAG